MNQLFDINNYTEIDGKLISKDEYYFNHMDRKEPIRPSKKERLKEFLGSLCSQDLTMIDPDKRKEAILYRLRLIEKTQKEYNETR